MPKKIVTNEAAVPARAVKSSTPRVKSVKHSKAAGSVSLQANSVEPATVNAHDAIARIAYGYWEARGFQAGSPEQDWLRAEQKYLLGA